MRFGGAQRVIKGLHPMAGPSWDQSRYFIAATRLHLPLSQAVPGDTQLARHSIISSVTPDYPVCNLRAGFVNFYMNKSGVGAQEIDTGNALTINGYSMKIGSTYYPATFGGASSYSIPDGGIVISDPVISTFVPIRTTLLHVTIDSVLSGQFKPDGMNRQNANGETQLNAATPDLTKLTGGTINSGNNAGTNNGLGYGPAFVIGQGWDGRDVVVWFGDSMGYAANDITSFAPASGVQGWIGRGLDDNSNGTRRLMGYNCAVEGTGMSTCSTRNAGEFRRRGQVFDAIKALNAGSKHALTAIISQHGNNFTSSTTAQQLTHFQTWWDFLRSEFPEARIIQTSAVPNSQDVSTSKWTNDSNITTTTPNTRAGLSGNLRWGASDSYIASPPSPLAGVINQAPAICGGANNDHWLTDTAFSALVTTANTAAGTTISIDQPVNVGDGLVFEPGTANVDGPIFVLTVTGTGPYVITTFTSIAHVHAIGATVKRSLTADGVHGTPSTHRLIMAPYIKAAKQSGLLR